MGQFKQAAIVGIYMTEQGNLPQRSSASLYVEAVKEALKDAGLTPKDVDGVIGPGPSEGLGSGMGASAFADYFGTQPLRFHATTGVGASSQGAGVGLAAMAIAHGLADVVVVPTAAGGVVDRDAGVARMGQIGSPFEWLWGTTRVADYAVFARRHMYEYGTTSEQLAEVAVAERLGATMNPLAVMGSRGLISIEDVVNSRMIADPLHLMDCCLINNGGGAIVMTSVRRARSLRKPPVAVLGWGEGFAYIDPFTASSMTTFGGIKSAPVALKKAGVRHGDIHVAGISDHFTFDVLVELEDAGFCKKGEGGPFVEGGTLKIGGRLPTNTDGGFLSCSHAAACGLYTVVELARQLRGEAGGRQVPNAQVAFSQGTGGVFQGTYSAVFGRV